MTPTDHTIVVPSAQPLAAIGISLLGTTLGGVGADVVGRTMQGMWFGVGVFDPGRSRRPRPR